MQSSGQMRVTQDASNGLDRMEERMCSELGGKDLFKGHRSKSTVLRRGISQVMLLLMGIQGLAKMDCSHPDMMQSTKTVLTADSSVLTHANRSGTRSSVMTPSSTCKDRAPDGRPGYALVYSRSLYAGS